MSKHDELCEKADVGSLCDCACAGSKHAVKHTRGGVPGAGSVSKRAQGLASKDGRAAVVNNRAVAKPGAPSTKRPAQAMDAKTGEKYEAVKKYDDAGKMVDRANGRRYDVVKKPLGDDDMAVTSRRRNGDTASEAVTKPGPPAPGNGRDKSETVKSSTRGGDVVEHTAPAGRETQAVRDAVAGITNQVGGDAAAAAYAKLTPADWGKLTPGQRHDIAEQVIANANNDDIRKTSPLGKNVAKARATLAGLPADAKRGTPVDRHHSPVGVGDVVTHETRGRGVVTLDASGQQAVSFDNSPGARRVAHDELKHGAPLTGPAEPAPAKTPPAAKVPAALRDINDVIDNPGAHLDQNAAARYQKLTREHMALMSPERKQAMLDDIVSRAKGYKPKSPTGQKLARAHSALVHQSSQHKEGMTASMVNRATAADQVTHPEHGHGRVKSTEYGGDGTTVDFGDKTVTVKQGSLVFGHTPGADTNTAAKAKAADAKQAARTAANNAKLMSFAADPSLSNFNTVSGYAPESFKALPAGDQAKMVTALKDLRDRHGSVDVKRRVAETLKKWGA